jgi:hypothetical protein
VAALAFNLWASLLALLLDGLGRAAARQACRRSSVQEQDTKDAKDANDSKRKRRYPKILQYGIQKRTERQRQP